MSWYYKGKEVIEAPADAVGMVYRIVRHISKGHKEMWVTKEYPVPPHSKMYIGKKSLTSTRKKTVGKRAMAKQLEECTDKRRIKKVERVVKDSGWMSYNSSNKQLQQEIKESPELFHKEILVWCKTKKEMTYYEIKYMMIEEVLEKDSYNDNIQGTIFRKDLSMWSKEKEESC